MQTPEEEQLLRQLENGTCSPEELDRIYAFVGNLPEARAHRVMEQLWEQSRFTDRLPATHYEQLEARIKTGRVRPLNNKRRRLLSWAGAAAAVLLLITAGSLWWRQAEDLIAVSTDFEEQRTVALPDGSTVQLNANSTLRFAAAWEEREDRQVWLDGEAFFTVTKKQSTGQKFRVTTPDLTVAVLGTVFNVNSHEERTTVFLEEGRISLELINNDEQEKVMEPGELLTYSAKQRTVITNVKQAASPLHTSWKDGVLQFEDTPLSTVIERVENIYGIRFSVSDTSIYQREITAGLPMEKLDIVLPLLEQALGLKIEFKEGHYLILE